MAVADGDRVGIVRVVGLAPQFERRLGAQAGDDVLASFEGDAGDLGVKARGVVDGRVRIAQILVAGGKDALDERTRLVEALVSSIAGVAPIEGSCGEGGCEKERRTASKAASDGVGGGSALGRAAFFRTLGAWVLLLG